jgi:hypothetical protein
MRVVDPLLSAERFSEKNYDFALFYAGLRVSLDAPLHCYFIVKTESF